MLNPRSHIDYRVNAGAAIVLIVPLVMCGMRAQAGWGHESRSVVAAALHSSEPSLTGRPSLSPPEENLAQRCATVHAISGNANATDKPRARVDLSNVNVSVRFTIGGDKYEASVKEIGQTDAWLDGPLVKEGRVTVVPATDGKLHPLLRVTFDLRQFADGAKQYDIAVANTLDVAGGTAVTYDVEISIDKAMKFRRENVRHHYLTRWRKVFTTGLAGAHAAPDLEPAVRAGALPRFLPSTSRDGPPPSNYDTSGPTFQILGRGGLAYDDMTSPGGRPELAPYPDWAVDYLRYRHPAMRAFLLANGDLAGSQPLHVTEVDGSLVSIDRRPEFWLDERGKEWVPEADKPRGDLTRESRGPLIYDMAHQPSLAYIPYLLTGDRYYSDEIKYWANVNLVGSHPTYARNKRDGLLFAFEQSAAGLGHYTGEVRSIAWPLRNLVDAAAYLPDADPDKAYFLEKVNNNLRFADEYAANHKSPLGTCFERISGSNSKHIVFPQWQHNYLAWSLDHALDQGFRGGAKLRDKLAEFQLVLLRSAPEYPPEYGAPYYPIVGLVELTGNRRMFTSMRQVFDHTYRDNDGAVKPPTSFDIYGADARLSLIICRRNRSEGAEATLKWLEARLKPPRPGYAIASQEVRDLTRGSGIGSVSLGRGWATFGLAVPKGAVRGKVRVGRLDTQVDVKTLWDDGSVRFAVVTVKSLSVGSQQIAAD